MNKEENQLREALDGNDTKSQRDLLARTVKSWNAKVRQIHDTENNRLRSTVRSSRSGRENFLWQIPQSSNQINDVSALVTAIERNPDYSSWPAAKGKWVERDLLSKIHGAALVSNIQGRARLEESRKDSDAPFVKDLGQTARALRRLVEQFGSQTQTGPMTKGEKDKIPEIRLVPGPGSGNQATAGGPSIDPRGNSFLSPKSTTSPHQRRTLNRRPDRTLPQGRFGRVFGEPKYGRQILGSVRLPVLP